MKRIIIQGGERLSGTVSVSGSKNAALPILFATVITNGKSTLYNVPDIGDTRVAIAILESLGAVVLRDGDTLTVDTRSLYYCDVHPELISAIRASTYLLGAMLARFGKCRISTFGGCNFANRPIDMHIDACLSFGGIKHDDQIYATELRGNEITFRKKSVGATINAIILAATAIGRTVIRGHALEPHVTSLVDFLTSAGAYIKMSESEIIIEGRDLHGGNITVIGDMIEAGSYLAIGAITRGDVTVTGCDTAHLSAFFDVLSAMGIPATYAEYSARVHRAEKPTYSCVTAEPYPGFPTDLQPIIAPLMACGEGGQIYDKVWTSRYGYLASLAPFGVEYFLDCQAARIGRSQLRPATTRATDLRGGMSAVLCALVTRGESVIENCELILRGYESLERKLRSLGANVCIE